MTRISFFLLFYLSILASHVWGDEPSPAVRVAVVQLDSSKAGDFDTMLGFAKAAKSRGAEIVVYPEEVVFGWLNPKAFYKAQPIPGQTYTAFATIAKEAGIWVATGLAERGPQVASNPATYEVFDSGILIDSRGARM